MSLLGPNQPSPNPLSRRTQSALATCLLAASLLPACTIHAGGTEDPARVADQLRTRVADLESQLASQQGELEELRAKLARAATPAPTDATPSPALSAEELAAIPTPVAVSIDARSGLSRDGTALDVLLTPVDGRGRFVQVAGTLDVQVFAITSQSAVAEADAQGETAQPELAAQAAPLWSRQLSPSALRDAYRSGFLGTHYLVSIPLSDELRAAHASGGLDVRISLDVAASDATLTTARSLNAR